MRRGSGQLAAPGVTGWQRWTRELSTREAAEALGVSASTISRARRTGQAPRALSDPDAKARLRRAHKNYARSKPGQALRKKRGQGIGALAKAPTITVNGRQGPKTDSPDAAIRNRRLDLADLAVLTPAAQHALAAAYARGGERALGRELAKVLGVGYMDADQGWALEAVTVTAGDASFTLEDADWEVEDA